MKTQGFLRSTLSRVKGLLGHAWTFLRYISPALLWAYIFANVLIIVYNGNVYTDKKFPAPLFLAYTMGLLLVLALNITRGNNPPRI